MSEEECSQCGKAVNEKAIMNLAVNDYYTGSDLNEPEFLICSNCWKELKEKLKNKKRGKIE